MNSFAGMESFWVFRVGGKVSAQPHTTLCIQFLDRENNDKNNALPLGKQICCTIVWGCAEILPGKLLMKIVRSLIEFRY